MAIHEKIIFNSGKTVIHFVGEFQQDYALCGQDLAGDNFMGESYSASETTREKVNCQDCIRIVEYCKQIDENEYK